MSTISDLGVSLVGSESTNTQQISSSIGGSTGSQAVGESEFLKLLVAQLQNQDPMDPINNQEFLAQLASFNSLEQLISINQAVTKLADGIDHGQSSTNSSSATIST